MIDKKQRKIINERIAKYLLETSQDDNQIKKIASEVLKEEAVNELKRAEGQSVLQFLSMPFTIFFLSTIIVGSFTYFFTEWRKTESEYQKNKQQISKIITELDNRIESLELATDSVGYQVYDLEPNSFFPLPIEIYYGKGFRDYGYSEYKNLSMTTLGNQLNDLNTKKEFESDTLKIILKDIKTLIDSSLFIRDGQNAVIPFDTILVRYSAWRERNSISALPTRSESPLKIDSQKDAF